MNAPPRPSSCRRLSVALPAALLACTALPLSAAPPSPLIAAATITTAPAAPTPAGSVSGLGDINLYPKRVVISDHNRTGNIGIYNKAANAGDYTITVADMAMTPDGRLIDLAAIKDGDPAKARIKGAAELLRWSPRRFTLPGNESQLVRLMARVSPDLPPGEYRTHFSVIAVPPGDDGLTIDQATGAQPAGDGIGVRITPRFGISIPVIIRVGETTLTSGLKDLGVVTEGNGHRLIRLTITRSGTRSSFGDLIVTAPGAGKPVAQIRGIGVYTEVDERTVLIPVDPAIDPRFTAGGAHLAVTYTDDDYAPGKTLARADFTVP